MARYQDWRHEGAMKGGFALLGVGVVLLLCSLVASRNGGEPSCGGERMTSGDYCSSSRTGPSSYEEMKSNTATAAFWLSRIGGIVTLGGAGLLIGERATRGLRAGLARRQIEAVYFGVNLAGPCSEESRPCHFADIGADRKHNKSGKSPIITAPISAMWYGELNGYEPIGGKG